MATWNSRGLRGSTLEDLINRTNEKYREQGLALIQKVPTPRNAIRTRFRSRIFMPIRWNLWAISSVRTACPS